MMVSPLFLRTISSGLALGMTRFSDEEKQLIAGLSRNAERESRALLPRLPDVIGAAALTRFVTEFII